MIHNYSQIIKDVLAGDYLKFSEEPFNVSFNERPEPGVFVADYDQIKSKRFATESDFFRGLVIQNNKILCMPYTRCYNVQEDFKSFGTDFKKATYTLEDKVDGSLIKVYRNIDGKWTIATRGTSIASNELWIDDLLVAHEKTTYQELFLKTAKMSYEDFCVWCDLKENVLMAKDPNVVGFTFLFELCTKLNKVVLAYEEDTIYFHGVSSIDLTTHTLDVIKAPGLKFLFKDTDTFYKLVPVIATISGVHYDSPAEILDKLDVHLLNYAKGKLIEGCIIHKCILRDETIESEGIHDFKDEYFKYKTNQYIFAHKLRGQSGYLNLADASEMYLANEHHEFLAYYPEYTFIFDNIDAVVKDMHFQLKDIFLKWNALKNDWTKTEREIKKEFFSMVEGHKYFHCIMNKYNHPELSPTDWLRKITTNSRVSFFEALGVKEKKV